MWAGIVVAVVLALWSTAGAWGGLPPHGEDVMSYLVRADFGLPQLVAHGRLDGWFPRYYLGYQEFLFNGAGVVWAMGAARAVTFGALSNTGALKVVGVLAFAALPAAMAFLARSLGLGRLAAGIAAILSLLVSSQFGPGLQGLYAVGLVSHQLGAPLFCLALGALLRVPRDTRWRWVLLAAVSLAGLAITHVISVMILAVVFPLLAFGLRREHLGRAALTRFALAGVLAAALAAWWLIPALVHRDLRGEVATWATPPFGDRIDAIVNGQILFRPYTVWIVIAGWVYGLVRVRRRPFAVVVVATPLVFLVLAHWAASRWPDNEFAMQLANRGLGYAGLLAILPLSAGIAAGARFATRRLSRWRWAGPAAVAAAMLVAVLVVVSPLGPDRGSASELEPPVPQLQHAAAELRRDVPDGARFVTQREYPGEVQRTGVLLPPTWLARASGRDSLNGWNLESSSTPQPDLEPDLYLGHRPADMQADVLSRLGVSHVVTTGRPVRRRARGVGPVRARLAGAADRDLRGPRPPRGARPCRARLHRRSGGGPTHARRSGTAAFPSRHVGRHVGHRGRRLVAEMARPRRRAIGRARAHGRRADRGPAPRGAEHAGARLRPRRVGPARRRGSAR